jgi:hypothetical protein
VTGITLRARWGQISEILAGRLQQCLGDRHAAAEQLRQVAESESGLTPEIDDWLRGRRRTVDEATSTLATSLRAVGNEELTESIALLLLDADEVPASPLETGEGETLHHARRLAVGIKSLASQRGLEVVGKAGDEVEYVPLAHQTVSGEPPTEIRVQIVRPMVVRRRRDGSKDIVLRAIVTEKGSTGPDLGQSD